MTGSEGAPAPNQATQKPMTVDKKPEKTIDLDTRLTHIEKKLDSVVSSSAAFHIPDSRFQPPMNNDEIDLRELWSVIWSGKWIIIATTFVFALASVFYALSLPNIYKSEALLAPADENTGGGLGGLAGQFGGLASLAGVSLSGGGTDKTTFAIEVLKSREFVSKFIQKHDLLVPLMAAKGWNRNHGELIIDPDIYDNTNNNWTRKPTSTIPVEPSTQEAYHVFMDKFSVEKDDISNFVYVAFEFYSPELTREWVALLINEINVEIKERDVAEAKKSIKYLSSQLEKTPVADMQTIFYELIEEQSKTVMFAEVRDEYVFKTIDKAIAPEIKVSPKRSLICIAGVFLGGIFGVIIVLIRVFLKKL